MTSRISACRPASTLRLAVFFGLAAATLTGSLAYPAYADDHDNRGRQRSESRREVHRHDGYYRQPDVYYSAPPVVYQPPGASLTFSFPFFR